jgi:hypothetical protein
VAEQKPAPRKLSLLWARMAQNIDENYLELFLITSQAAGLEPSEGRPLGAGKSTLGVTIGYRAFAYENGTLYIDWKNQQIVDETPEDEKLKLMRMVVEQYTFWSLHSLLKAIKSTARRLPAVVWDDVQLDCPAWQHIPPAKREMIEELSVSRPLVANIVMTAPSMSDIAKPLRRQVNWEIIIPTRGTYEVHFIGKRRDFYQPTEDQSRLWYDATGTFEPLPTEIMQLYNKRREEVARQMKRERMLEEAESVEERIVQYYKKGLAPGIIARLVGSTKENIIKLLQRKGLNVTEEI